MCDDEPSEGSWFKPKPQWHREVDGDVEEVDGLVTAAARVELLEEDPILAESAGEMMKCVQRVRDPKGIQLVWPFFGAPGEVLRDVCAALLPQLYTDDASLCDAPRDPCATLSILVLGEVSVMRGSADEVSLVDKLGPDAALGATELRGQRRRRGCSRRR